MVEVLLGRHSRLWKLHVALLLTGFPASAETYFRQPSNSVIPGSSFSCADAFINFIVICHSVAVKWLGHNLFLQKGSLEV